MSGTHVDSTGVGNDGTCSGGVSMDVSGAVDGCDGFDGVDDKITCGVSSLPTTEGTVSVWARPDGGHSGPGGPDMFLMEMGSASNDRQLLYFNDDGHVRMFVQDPVGGTHIAPSDASSWSDDWYYFVGTWDSSSVRLFVDGVEDSTPAGSNNGISTSSSCVLGAAGLSSGSWFNGGLDEVRISKTARNSSWIGTEYNMMNDTVNFTDVGPLEYTPVPVVSEVNPVDEAVDVSLGLSSLSFVLTDFQNDSMEYWVESVPDVGSAHDTVSVNGLVSVPVVGLLAGVTYTWFVNVTDGSYEVNESFSFTTVAHLSDWQYRKQITVDHTLVDERLTGFPLLVDIAYDSDLAAGAQVDFDDVLFTNDSVSWNSGTVADRLSHEIEYYDNVDGNLTVWIRLPVLSNTSDTVLYLYYGNSGCESMMDTSGVWNANYRLVQHLCETSGVHVDSSGYGNDGTCYGSVSQDVAGLVDGCDGFDGSSGYVDCGSDASLDFGSGDFSVSYWLKTSATETDNHVVSKYGTTGVTPRWLSEVRDGKVNFGIRDSSSISVTVTSTKNVNDDVWHYVVGMRDGDDISLFVDGEFEGSVDASSVGSISNDRPVLIARLLNYYYPGLVDEVRLSDSSRDASWIKTEYVNQGVPDSFFDVSVQQDQVFPFVYNEFPENNSVNVGLNPTLSASVDTPSENSTDWWIRSNASGSWTVLNSGTLGGGNGTVSGTGVDMDAYSTTYFWCVNVSDTGSNKWSNRSFQFTSRPENYPPTVSDPYPVNESSGVVFDPVLAVDVEDLDEESLTVVFTSNCSGSWVELGNYSGGNGRYSQSTMGMDVLDTMYYWRVHVFDGSVWTNRSFVFTTVDSILPVLKWSKVPVSGYSHMGPLVADLDGDGFMEIIRTGGSTLEVLNGTTGELWWSRSDVGVGSHSPFEIIDLDKDGLLEIIVSRSGGTSAIHGVNGTTFWHNANAPSDGKHLVAGDIDADGYPEVFVCTTGQITAMTYDGQIYATTSTYYPCWGGLTLGDTDHDGVFELYQNDRSNWYPSYPSAGEGIRSYWASNLTKRWSYPSILCSSHCLSLIHI